MNEERGKIAFEIDTRIKERENKRRILLAENAEDLNIILSEKYYKELLGDDEGQWAGYLSNIEVFYSRNKVDVLTRIYKKLSLKLDIPKEAWIEVPIQRLTELLPVVDEKNYVQWLSKALELTTRDWNIEIRHAKGQVTEEDEHEHKNQTYEICKVCGKKAKLHTHKS